MGNIHCKVWVPSRNHHLCAVTFLKRMLVYSSFSQVSKFWYFPGKSKRIFFRHERFIFVFYKLLFLVVNLMVIILHLKPFKIWISNYFTGIGKSCERGATYKTEEMGN